MICLLLASSNNVAAVSAQDGGQVPGIVIPTEQVGRDLQIEATGALGQPAPPGGVVVTLTSEDSSRLAISNSAFNEGGGSLTFFVATGETTFGPFYLQGLQHGLTPYTATAPGYVSSTRNVAVDPSGFGILPPWQIETNTLENVNLTLCAFRLNPNTLIPAETQSVLGGSTVLVSLANTDPVVGSLSPNPVAFSPLNNCQVSQFDSANIGETLISVLTPSVFTTPATHQSVVVIVGEPPDIDGDGVPDVNDNCPETANANQADADEDEVGDVCDNCLMKANPDQCNTNAGSGPGQDQFGNLCDADLDNNGVVNSFDLSTMRANLGQFGMNDADIDCNGMVDTSDLTIMRADFGQPPGPSGIAP